MIRQHDAREQPFASTRARLGAAVVAIAPAVLLAGFVSHPYIGMGPPDESAIAAAVAADTARWGLSHLAVGAASGFLVLAFLAIRSHLREAGEQRWSAVGLPFVVVGSTLFALLPGIELGLVAVAETGGDVQAAQEALFPWFLPTLLTGAVTFAVGVFAFGRGIARSGVLNPRLTRLVVGGLVVMAAARFVPLGAVQFYVQGAAGLAALWPLASEMWKRSETRPAGQPRPVRAS